MENLDWTHQLVAISLFFQFAYLLSLPQSVIKTFRVGWWIVTLSPIMELILLAKSNYFAF